jgi:hypothetical protein
MEAASGDRLKVNGSFPGATTLKFATWDPPAEAGWCSDRSFGNNRLPRQLISYYHSKPVVNLQL